MHHYFVSSPAGMSSPHMKPWAEPDAEVRTILTVDDQPANLRVVIDCLERHGLRVVVALSGDEALERARYVRPDLVLLDVHMPGLDGFDTCRQLKTIPSTQDIPVIFMTSATETPDKLAAFAAGGVDYVTKPVNEEEVLARVNTHLTLSALRRQLEAKNAELARSNIELEQLAIERAVRARAEGESAGLRKLLEERDQMLADREDMLRLLAHEVRQPLNNASAALQSASAAIAGLGGEHNADIRRPLLRAEHVLDHVIGTLNNALAAATMLTSGWTEPIADTDLDTLIGLVVHDMAAEDRSRITVESRTAMRTVQVQPLLMRLALSNLLSNALAYSPSGSPVQLRIRDGEEPPAIVLEVADRGEGIAADLLPRVFDKGTRGRNALAKAGAGLGLYIVRKVVELHRGSIEIVPNPPRGSIARMTIPQGIEV
ncbi:hybrid sensor histidine kinase/response regulator [Piscinibacter terrae]|uniref:histidine kinase n=1 Tax=Piscinibacter terrae TaxID=2496871 RepID=A0A3N7HUC5_9BURK|nr:hybrid sensor histidine kinase/response regulator [Albitalea terrae]RQP24906.1 hybrid sensor histidine kinase/response regulator [Albitalea terrae]